MTKKEKKNLNRYNKPKQSVQLNKKLIIGLAIFVFTAISLAMISAFDTGKKDSTPNGSAKTKIQTDMVTEISPAIKNLPNSYADVDSIRSFIPKPDNSAELSLLLRQLRRLESEHEMMKRQLAKSKEPQPEIKMPDDPHTKQAKKSDLVFGGLAGGMDSLVGPNARDNRSPLKKDEDLVATEEQAEFFKKENENKQKLAVFKGKDRPEDIYDMHNVMKPVSKYQVMAGTMIPASLITGINTTLGGSITAQVRNDIYDTVTGKYLLIPKGSKLLGEYNPRVSPGQQRILMAFTRLIRPDGSSILLGRPFGSDIHGLSGIEGNVDNHWAQILGASTISAVLSFGAGAASDSYAKADTNSSRQNGILGAGNAISQVGNRLTQRAMNMQPTITLPAGHQFNVSVKRDMVLSPYKK